jgi:hypothetical protein
LKRIELEDIGPEHIEAMVTKKFAFFISLLVHELKLHWRKSCLSTAIYTAVKGRVGSMKDLIAVELAWFSMRHSKAGCASSL